MLRQKSSKKNDLAGMDGISKVKKEIEKYGVTISTDQIHKLGKMGIIQCHTDPQTLFRYFDSEDLRVTVTNILLYYHNATIAEIIAKDLQLRVKLIKKAYNRIKRGL